MENVRAVYIAKITEQIGFAQSDLRSFVYLRMQPAFWSGPAHGLGGGNIAGALCSFALLASLSKCFRAITKPEEFVLKDDPRLAKKCSLTKSHCVRLHETNESAAFSAYVQWLKKRSVDIGLVEGNVPAQVWKAFRNSLVHRFGTSELIPTFKYPEHLTASGEADVLLRFEINAGQTPLTRGHDQRLEFRVALF